MTTLTMRIDPPMEAALASLAKATHRSKSDLARAMLRRELAVLGFQFLREQALPHAEAAGYITDQDVFRDVSSTFSSTPMCWQAHWPPEGFAVLFESVLIGHELLASQELLAESRRILTTKLRIPAETADTFLTLIDANATSLPTPAEFPAGIPDPDDAPLIAAALAGGAECFVTGDKALLDLGTVAGMPVISPRRFWELSRHER